MNGRFIVTLLVALATVVWVIFTDGLLIVGILVGILCYHHFGLQPRLIGWSLALVALVVVWRTGLWLQGFELVAAINLAIMALLSFYYQMRDEEAKPPLSETDALQVRDVFSLSGGRFREQLRTWTRLSRSCYSIWGAWAISWGSGNMAEIPFYCLAAVASILISVRLSGGSRGKVWEKINNALQVQGGIVPRPSIN